MDYLIIKYVHVVSSTILFGTGIGSAFYLLVTALSGDARCVALVSKWVVRADWLFTATTAVLQPLTGLWLAHAAGLPLRTPWLLASLVAYAAAIGCWLPVVWLQMRMRDIARSGAEAGALPRRFWTFFWTWFGLGVPALFLFLGIFWLMVAKPSAGG